MARGGFRPGAGRPRGAKTQNVGIKAQKRAKSALKQAISADLPDYLRDDASPPSDISPAAAAAFEWPNPDGSDYSTGLKGEDLAKIAPLDYALAVIRNPKINPDRRDRLAIALLPYLHKRVADARKSVKEEKRTRAGVAAEGDFSPQPPPKLRAVK